MPIEIELKLQLDPRHIARLRSHALFKRATHSASRKLYSIYYDTPDLRLWQAGVALRLRRVGNRWIQTIKSESGVSAGMHQRNEFETEVASQVPDLSVIGGALAAHFAASELRARLKPVMITDFTRMSCLLKPAAGATIEASIDRGVITGGELSEQFCELELEVKSGPPWCAYQAALQLLEVAPLLVEDRSKAERGKAMYLREPRAPRKAPPSPVTADMSVGDAFSALVQSCLSHYITNVHGLLEDANPEYLHQARVALRRLRSVFDMFSPLLSPAALAAPIAETRWLARELGRARDWDVFAAETLAPAAAHNNQNAGLAALTRSAMRLRQVVSRETHRAVASARGQGLMLLLGCQLSAETWLEAPGDMSDSKLREPIAGVARTILDGASQRVARRGKHINFPAPRQLHRLRIAVKKLRYGGDFFAPLFPRKRFKPYLARLAELQEILGIINDTTTTPQLLAELGAPGAAPRRAFDAVTARNASLRARAIKRLPRAWRQFKRAKAFW